MRRRSRQLKAAGRSIAFVPTMGFLHEGHLSLMREGRRRADVLVASIFVNPTQFAPSEDFATYPRNPEGDSALTRAVGVDILFTPDSRTVYPEGYQTYVQLEALPHHLCGLSRPVFFRGVATVVTKLFHIVQPDIAIFGEKDYQQLMVIRRMVQDLDFGIEIVGGPTVREPDGLAMSSRNAYLTPAQRPAALSLYQTLQAAAAQVAAGEQDAARVVAAARERIGAFPETAVDYIAIVDPETLADVAVIDRPVRMALAVWVGKTRLIDNLSLSPDGTGAPPAG
jgi:pantoate--beta-alanine ligase